MCLGGYQLLSPLNKMAAILADDISKAFCRIPIQISQNFVSMSPFDKKAALVQVMAWRIGDKPLPEPMMTQFTDAYIRH